MWPGKITRRQGMVCAHEIAAVLPYDPRRPGSRHAAACALYKSRFLIACGPSFLTAGTKQVVAAAQRSGSMPCASRRRMRSRRRARLAAFLALGRHGDMDWMATRRRRRHPRNMWPEVRSVVMLGMSYAPPSNPLDASTTHSAASSPLRPVQGLPRRRQGQAEAPRRRARRDGQAPTSRSSSTPRR